MSQILFPPPPSADVEDLRQDVREFLAAELRQRSPRDRARSWSGFDADFSRKVGRRGWIGMTWPKQYGGHERSALERYVVLEEMLAVGAPVAAHWIADRQSGPLLLKAGTERHRRDILPRIAAGECFFCIGMSEPDSGSDLAGVRTRAIQVEGGFLVNGIKLWTTYAHKSHYMILLCRTEVTDDRHGGTSQFLVDLSLPGISVRPIADMSGEHHFNEVVFDDAFIPSSAAIGRLGDGWGQVMGELSFERSGPDRFLSSFTLVVEAVRLLGEDPSDAAKAAIGRIVGHLLILRRLSRSVAGMLQNGDNPSLQAALVKDQGASIEQEIPEIVRSVLTVEPTLRGLSALPEVLAHIVMNAPSFSLRGGTREILRGIVARGLGVG